MAIATNHVWGPSPISQKYDEGFWSFKNDRVSTLNAAVSTIPKDAGVSAVYYIVPHLTHRTRIYEFPNPFKPTNWGVRDEKPHSPRIIQYIILDERSLTEEHRATLAGLEPSQFTRIFDRDDIFVLKRKQP